MSRARSRSTRRYRKAQHRRVWVFSELNHDLTPEQIARILAAAALERAAEERAKRTAVSEMGSTGETSAPVDVEEDPHA